MSERCNTPGGIVEIYLHCESEEDPRLLEVDDQTTIAELARLASPTDAESVWVAEAEEPLRGEATLHDAGIAHRHHVHCGRCTRVEVRIRFGGDDRERVFSPAATIATVFKWAVGRKGFNLTDVEAAKHVLAACDGDHALDRSTHVGSLVTTRECVVCLDLAPKERFEG